MVEPCACTVPAPSPFHAGQSPRKLRLTCREHPRGCPVGPTDHMARWPTAVSCAQCPRVRVSRLSPTNLPRLCGTRVESSPGRWVTSATGFCSGWRFDLINDSSLIGICSPSAAWWAPVKPFDSDFLRVGAICRVCRGSLALRENTHAFKNKHRCWRRCSAMLSRTRRLRRPRPSSP